MTREAPSAEVIDIGVRWSAGAPIPHVVTDGGLTFLVCFVGDPDPGWDGTNPREVSPADEQEELFAIIEVWGCASIRFGHPNDEVLQGHPLYQTGLKVLCRSRDRRLALARGAHGDQPRASLPLR